MYKEHKQPEAHCHNGAKNIWFSISCAGISILILMHYVTQLNSGITVVVGRDESKRQVNTLIGKQ